MTLYEIPLSGAPQTFTIALPVSGSSPPQATVYRLMFQYRDALMGGWVMDIYDNTDTPLVCGIPLVTGVNLLEQYGYLNFGGIMAVYSDGVPDAVPTFDNLGSGGHLVWVTDP